jgi:type I restriction-modification system DNA methylase subunit
MCGPLDIDLLVSLTDIAELAGKTPSAVSNWRKRYQTFPLPKVESPSGALFDFREVEKWLVETDRLDRPIQPSQVLWNVANSLRDLWTLDQISGFIFAALVYFEACHRAESPQSDVRMNSTLLWKELQWVPEDQFSARLVGAARSIEAENPSLDSLMSVGFEQYPQPSEKVLLSLMRLLEMEATDEGSRVELIESLNGWRSGVNRFLAEQSTPNDLAYLMANIALKHGRRVFDPAVGSGWLLLMVAVMDDSTAPNREYIGFDTNEQALRECRSVFFIYNQPADLRCVNSLREKSVSEIEADVVVLDPPFGVVQWGDASVYQDPRWLYGPPSPNDSNFAWLQMALMSLRPGGVALVDLPLSTTFCETKDKWIAQNLLQSGAVVAVVLLPPRMRRNTSVPLALWVLRRPEQEMTGNASILVVDASKLGRPGREEHQFEEDELLTVAQIVESRLIDGSSVSNPLITQVLIPGAAIEEGNLLGAFKRLQQTEAPGVETLRERSRVLRRTISESFVLADQAIAELIAIAEESS